MEAISISVIAYQEGDCWIAQGLEFDVTAQASSPQTVFEAIAAKLAAEVAISIDLGEEPLQGIKPAPQEFWRMYEASRMSVDAEVPPVRISDGAPIPRIVPRMKLGQLEAA